MPTKARGIGTVERDGATQFVGEADCMLMEIAKPYGCLAILITLEGKIVLESKDGEGKTLERQDIDPDDLVGSGEED